MAVVRDPYRKVLHWLEINGYWTEAEFEDQRISDMELLEEMMEAHEALDEMTDANANELVAMKATNDGKLKETIKALEAKIAAIVEGQGGVCVVEDEALRLEHRDEVRENLEGDIQKLSLYRRLQRQIDDKEL